MLECLVNGIKSGKVYPEAVRKFCFAVSYHSPAAYEVLRKQFNKNLPHLKTIQTWYALSDISCEPGLTDGTLKRLKGFVDDLNGEQLLCALIFDEMYLRQQVFWDENKFEYAGFTSYGVTENKKHKKKVNTEGEAGEPPNLPIAKKALNFMLSGINKHFTFPLAYHLVDSLKGNELAPLIKEFVLKVSECGVKIVKLTFDGDTTNLAACKLLGANLDINDENYRPYIENPFDQSKIYLILDPSHMEKLMRNLLGSHKVLFDEFNNRIEWQYFVDLYNLSKDGHMLTHKLNRKHIEFERNSMNVRLAAETFSSSTGDSMELLRKSGHPQFVNSAPTARFVYKMDTIFNIFNSTTRRNENDYKCALSEQNKSKIFDFIKSCMEYLKSLQMMVKRKRNGLEVEVKVNVLKTRNKTPVLGFLMDMTNLLSFYGEYVESRMILKEVRTYSFSQDHLEIFHSKIRARNGHNSNPNSIQYKAAFRRLTCNMEIRAPESANCILLEEVNSSFTPQSNVYFISSRRPKLDIINDESFRRNLALQQSQIQDEFDELENLADLDGVEITSPLHDGIAGASIAYAARLIEKKIEGQIFYCDCCKFVFAENRKLIDVTFHLIESKKPCASTFLICKIVDKFMKLYKPKCFDCLTGLDRLDKDGNENKEKDFRVLYYMIFKEIDFDKMYEDSDFKDHEPHKFHLVKCIIKEYIRIKTSQISKKITLSQYDKLLRTKLTRWIHFCGQ